MNAAADRPRHVARPAAVLWDMDGTLVDTEPYWIEVEHELVAQYGHHWDMEKAHSLVGHDLRDSARIMQNRGGVRLEVDEIVNLLLDGVIDRVRRQVPWRPGARELLADLNAAGVPCALVTMSWQRFATAVLNALPQGSFQAVISGDMVQRGKPHPEPYLTAAATLGVRPERCVAIEDSPTGVRSAVAAGCVTFAVPNVVDITPGEGYTVVPGLDAIPRVALGLGRPGTAPRDPTPSRSARPVPGVAAAQAAQAVAERTRRRRRRSPALAYLGLAGLVAAGAVGGFVLRNNSQPPLKDIPVSAWAPYWELEAATASITANGSILHQVSPFWFTAKGSTTIQYSANITEADTLAFAAAARASGAKVIPAVTDSSGAGIMASILADPERRTKHVQTLVLLAADYDGIDLDYEAFAFEDSRSTWEATRPNWVAFVEELAVALHEQGKLLVVTIPPVYDTDRTSDSGYWVYDARAIGKVADFVRFMAYDYSTSSPGPIAPIEWVRTIVKAAKRLVDDDSKIVLGIPRFGRNWVTSTSGTCPEGVPGRVSPTQMEVADLLDKYTITPTRDTSTEEAVFTYERPDGTGACTQTREVHYVDAQGVRARVDLARELRIGGVVFWAMGFETPDSWTAVADVARPRDTVAP